MQKKNQKLIIGIIVVVLLLLLILFSKNIINLQNKNKINLAKNTENELISNEPNKPELAAGMIPIKWKNGNWVITTKEDEEWYNAQPAYMMLNDGYYKSEIEQGLEEKQLAENNVGVDVPDDPNATIHTRHNICMGTKICIQIK